MNVLVVENDLLIRMFVSDVLADAGYAVAAEASAEAALRRPAEDRPAILVTDIDLGIGMNGLDYAAMAQYRFPGIRVIFVSGNPGNLKDRKLGSNERFLPKPFGETALLKEMEYASSCLSADQ